jgi:adenylate cyclase
MSFFAELKRRNVFRVAIAYIVLAWIIMQVGDTLAPALHLPESVNSVLAFFLILGFPLAVFFAWAFELTPDGLKLEKNVERDTSITPITGQKLDRTIIVLLAVALVYFIWHSQTSSTDGEELASNANSIAVLPFQNMSSDAEQEYFSDGLSEELLNLLAKIPELRVSSRSSAFSYKGKDFKISDVGRELDVAHVLEGSVRKSGDKVRITAQLIQADTDTHLWSETWDRSLDDVFVIQDEIAKAVVDELKVRLLGELPQARTTDPEAYSLFLQARHLANQRTADSVAKAETIVLQALQIDPAYLPAWVLKAHIYSIMGDIGFGDVNASFDKAMAAAETAVKLDPDYGPAHALLGDVLISNRWDFAGGRREIELALALDPADVDTLYQACVHFGLTGEYEKGIELCEKAAATDPVFPPIPPAIGLFYRFLDQPEKALEATSKMLDLQPGAAGTHYYITLSLLSTGDIDGAFERIQHEVLDGFKLTGLALVHHAAGRKKESDEATLALESQISRGWYYQVAMVRAYRGEIDAAFEALNDAYEKRDSGITLLLGDPYLDNLRGDPRFEAMVERLGIRLHKRSDGK